jgi:hypothetical protein
MRRISLLASLLAAVFVAAPAMAQTKTAAPATTKAAAPATTKAAAPAAAATAASGPTMDNTISVWGILGYQYSAGSGFGLGARYQKVVVPEGFLHLTNGIKDELGIEGGIDYLHYSWDFYGYGWSYNEFNVVAGVTWNFWLNPKLALYPKLDLGFGFGSWSSDLTGDTEPSGYGGIYFAGSAGIVYKLDRLLLRAEVGSGSLRAGVAFGF